jgi:hypothetical protein
MYRPPASQALASATRPDKRFHFGAGNASRYRTGDERGASPQPRLSSTRRVEQISFTGW